MSDFKYDIISKVVVVGDGAVGKSSLIKQFTMESFDEEYISTIGAQFSKYTRIMEDGKIQYRLLFWDIAGQDEFSFMRPTFYNGAEGVILVYDLTRPKTFESIENWYKEVVNYCGEIPAVLFGNKVDLINPAEYDRGPAEELVKRHGFIGFYMTSAKTGEKVTDAFNKIIDYLFRKKIKAKNKSR